MGGEGWGVVLFDIERVIFLFFFRQMCVRVTHGLGMLSVHSVAELQQGLKLIVSGERDDLQHGAKLTEDLKKQQ